MDKPSLIFSLIAVALSIYGVVERHKAALRSTRTQLAALLVELNELNLTEVQTRTAWAEGAPGAGRDLGGALNFRRALIAEQATSLERMIRGRDVVPEEYSTLAYAYESLGDSDRALQLWEQAVDRATNSSVITQVACRRSLAGCRYMRGDIAGARESIEAALALLPEHDRGWLDRVETLLELADMERRAAPGGPQETQALERARFAETQIREPDLKSYAARVVAGYAGRAETEVGGPVTSPVRDADVLVGQSSSLDQSWSSGADRRAAERDRSAARARRR
ncbi:hypothetical protein [Cellulomonas humilata]|uniref:Tetratricopeptide (TPR) repeat protein n=1 Tax=Cellulomonas humilata TaxID=144055 RepID=A0ABU0EJT6_9CELL|nr:hypothetical protein [Cellulomonas humilata]MDQ0375555.1 tetratricopeptide (TPR) repeat protein [Cellulomonas humilata]